MQTPANEFAPVANLSIYRRLLAAGELWNYHLHIATEVVKDPVGWHDFWMPGRSGQFIIMDNGLIETGAAADTGLVGDAADIVGASCVILPDALGEYYKTQRLVVNSYDDFRKIGLPLMGVVQGKTATEVVKMLKLYDDMEVDYISIPRVMVGYHGTRRWIVERAAWNGRPIHLLGWSENLEDDLRCAALPGVMGIDSAVPIWWGLTPNAEHFPYRPPMHAAFGKRPVDYWTKDADNNRVDMDIVLANIRWVRNWIGRYVQDVLTAAKVSAHAGPIQPPSAS